MFPVRLLPKPTRVALLAILALAACQDRLPTEPEVPIATCADPGRVLAGTASDTLAADAGPFHLEGRVEARGLVVEAGTLVCGAASATLVVLDSLVAVGNAEEPIVFTAIDPSTPWGGIVGPPEHEGFPTFSSARMAHVLIEHAQVGLRRLRVDGRSLRLRRIEGVAIDAEGTLEDVEADTVCTICQGAAAAIQVSYGYRSFGIRTLWLSDVVVRGSGGHGLVVPISSVASVSDLVIVGPAGTGVAIRPVVLPHRPGELLVRGPIEITGQRGYLAEGSADGVAAFLEAYGERTRAGDSLYTVGSTARDVVLGEGVLWRAEALTGLNEFSVGFARLTMRAGAELHAERASFGSLEATGTADRPVRLSGWSWSVGGTGRLLLEHTRFEMASPPQLPGSPGNLTASGSGSQRIADAVMSGGRVSLSAPGALVERVSLDGGGLELWGAGSRAEEVSVTRGSGHGVLVAADDVEIAGCVVTGHVGDGVHVAEGARVSVGDCDLESNGGAGVANEGQDLVLAEGNWWGDPAGPLGPRGDGVRGLVDASGARATPRSARPASVTLASDVAGLPTGDSVRFTVEARDAGGRPAPAIGFVLRALDDRLVFPDPADPSLAVARRAGVAGVEAFYLADETLRASAEVEVEPGAPYLEWSWVEEDPEGAVAVLPLSPTQLVVVEHEGDEVRFHDRGTTTVGRLPAYTCCVPPVLGGTGLDDVWAAVHRPSDGPLRFTMAHWDGASWGLSEEREGWVSEIWARSATDVLVVWSGGASRWNGETWTDEWSAPDGWGCRDVPGASALDPWLLCLDPAGVGEVLLLRRVDSVWQEVTGLPPAPEGLSLDHLVVHPSGRLYLAGVLRDWAVLDGGDWRALSTPAALSYRDWLPIGDGAIVQSFDGPAGDGLWHLAADGSWQRLWMPQGRGEGSTFSPRQRIHDLASVPGAVFMARERGVVRGIPQEP